MYSNYRTRTELFYNSFFPKTIREWNLLPPEIKSALTELSFKFQLRKTDEFRIIPPPKWFSYGNRKPNIILTQLRHNCSSLNGDLFMNHVSNDPTCKNCMGNRHEDSTHFFLNCPKYERPRTKLFRALTDLQSNHELETLINGSADKNYEINRSIMTAVHIFISETHRFD